jgi:hypothetical protein
MNMAALPFEKAIVHVRTDGLCRWSHGNQGDGKRRGEERRGEERRGEERRGEERRGEARASYRGPLIGWPELLKVNHEIAPSEGTGM